MCASLELWNEVFLQNVGKYSVVVKVRIFKNAQGQDGGREKMF